MDKKREDLYIDELKTQVDFALFSIKNINFFLEQMDDGKAGGSDNFWYYAQNLVVYSGNISKILWGVKDRNKSKNSIRKKERQELRGKLKIENDSLLKNRSLRNALEHIDEKLEEFTDNENNIIFNKNIFTLIEECKFEEGSYRLSKEKNLRHYDPITKTFYFYGEKVNLQDLYRSINLLKKNISEYKNQTVR